MQTIGLKSPVSAVETVGADMSEGLQVSSEWAGPLEPYPWKLTPPSRPQVMKTCRMMGIQTVAVHSDVDACAVS